MCYSANTQSIPYLSTKERNKTVRILLIEDDALIGDGIKVGLEELGFSVDWFSDGLSGQQALSSAPYDAAVLDLTLPRLDGLEVLRQWRRQSSDIPVLILTARDALEQRVSGLQQGADDYLCKPFSLVEVAARLQVLIRRRHGQTTSVMSHGDVVFDSASRSVTLAGKPITMTAREISLLELFLHHKGHVLSKNAIQDKLYSWEDDVSSNTVEVYIHHLRSKLGKQFISTVYGIGYKIGVDE